jgi:hypothetical protein
MADFDLTQKDAEQLMVMEKKAIDQRVWMFPSSAERISVPLISTDSIHSGNPILPCEFGLC